MTIEITKGGENPIAEFFSSPSNTPETDAFITSQDYSQTGHQLSEQEIKSNLCYYDPKNPNNNLDAYEDEDRPQPRKKCYCDNCFYGRDKLAMQLLEVKRERDEALKVFRLNKHHCDSHRDMLGNCIVCQMEGAK